ncbi:hypothetical protein [Pseudalkalibacillus berkeleyi]|uniref:Uncharacterized protein n=1 Tax=Pseudalkalibacillus berkeleyi TaxID=1069813 RepID=A0ABS9GX75_9BACL|nr:hypothetical protein [Pseudalkalibacillus berkeleyi]MCF6136331.1 hypothetical protein [Pseudalkalibacillus berkeleyi]
MIKKKAIWIGTLGLATMGMMLPQFVGASTSDETPTMAIEQKEEGKMGHHFKKHLMKDEFQALQDEGYSKKEILKASHIANATDTKIDDVLAHYKSSESWKETAEQFGLDPERHAKRTIGKALHKNIDKEKFEALTDEGYSKEEIMKAMHIAKAADKSVEEVLTDYKETNSWETTMENLGVNKEDLMKHKGHKGKWAKADQYLEKHKEKVITYLNNYSGEDVSKYLENDMHLHHLVGAAVVAELSGEGTSIADVIEFKKGDHTREEFKEKFNFEKEEFHTEMEKVWTEMKASFEE